MSTAAKSFADGARTFAPIIPGVVPFAAVSGFAAIDSGMSVGQAFAMAIFVYAGAAQIATTQLIEAAAPAAVMVMTAMLINLRFAVYSASLGQHFRHLSLGWRALIAYHLTDQAYALSVLRFNKHEDEVKTLGHWYFLGVATVMWLAWLAGSAAGILLGTGVPKSWALDFAVPLSFMALLVPSLTDGPMLTAAITGGVIAVACAVLPYNLGLILAVFGGIFAGVIAERRGGANRDGQGESDGRGESEGQGETGP